MLTEKATSPFLYSFFQGLKYVFIKRGRENNCRSALFKEEKKEIRERGVSINQNFKKIRGNDK